MPRSVRGLRASFRALASAAFDDRPLQKRDDRLQEAIAVGRSMSGSKWCMFEASTRVMLDPGLADGLVGRSRDAAVREVRLQDIEGVVDAVGEHAERRWSTAIPLRE